MRPSIKRKAGVLVALVVLLLASLAGNSDVRISVFEQSAPSESAVATPLGVRPHGSHATSDVEPLVRNGILNPVELEHQGYVVSPYTTVRTDLDPSIYYDLPLDSAHNWTGSTADTSIYGLRKIYAVNGTFQTGTPGTNYLPQGDVTYHPLAWDALSNSTDAAQNQTATYDSSGLQYVTVENWGKKIGASGKQYTHVAGTRILWYQDIGNHPYADQFNLSFSYLYSRGPLGSGTPGACSMKLYVDGTARWSQNLPSLAARGVWYSTGSILVNASGIGSGFRLMIGLEIDTTMALNADSMYDGVTLNGILNTFYITAQIDNVVMVGQTAPSFDSVDLKMTAGGQTSSIVGGEGNGEASVVLDPYWTTDPLRVSVSSNDTVTYAYRARMFAHYFVNSTWTTDISKQGVSYAAGVQSANLSFFFYVGSLGIYEDFSIIVRHPSDWTNATVYDALQYDMTGACFMTSGEVIVPGSAVTLFGWWELHLQSPDYAESISAQIYDSFLHEWTTASQYRSGNITRAQIVVGANGEHPSIVTGLEAVWKLPNGTVWAFQYLTGSGLLLNSPPLTLGAVNTTAGLWMMDVFWCNGTEIALGRLTFEVIHRTTLTPYEDDIVTSQNATVTNFVMFRDLDNGEYLMDEDASVLASFAGSPVSFMPNLVRNWWEGDFDTSLIESGVTTVTVSASLSHYDSSVAVFTITIPHPTQLEIVLPSGQTGLTCGIGETIEVPFMYSLLNESGVDFTSATVFYSGPEDGLTWNIVKQLETGNYTLEILASASGIYEVTVQASRASYEPASDSLLLFVEGLSSDLVFMNGTTEVINYGEQYVLVVRYVNSTGYGIENATVLATCNPTADMTMGSVDELGDGYYSVLLSPQRATSFLIEVTATREDYKLGYGTFSLGVTEIPTLLQQSVGSQTIAIDRNCTVTLLFTDEDLNPILGATVGVVSPPEGLSISSTVETGGGYYEITIDPLNTGSYLLTFSAECTNYMRAATSLNLHFQTVPTVLTTQTGLSSGNVEFGRVFGIVVLYNRTDDGLLIPGATINVTADQEGLLWDISEDANGYHIRLWGNMTATWVLYFTASKTDHDPFSIRFVLTVNSISTVISASIPVTSFHVTRSYAFNITFQMENGTGIDGLEPFATGDKTDWFSFVSLGHGVYGIVFSPDAAATFRSYIHFARTGFQSRVYNLDYTVSPIPLSVESNTVTWTQGQPLDIVLALVEADTLLPVTDSTVQYELRQGVVLVASGTLEPDGFGEYHATVNIVWTDRDDLEFAITVEDDSRTLLAPVTIPVLTIADPFIQTMNIITQVGPPTLLAVIGIAGWRYVRAKRAARRRELTAENLKIRQRFSDAQNILGFLVLHKTSGLPVFSKSLRPGLDEAIVSGFISAITLFRSEFKIEESNWEFGIVPISDVIRAVPTKNLICAMVTLSSPSGDQETRMLTASDHIGQEFDSLYEEAPTEYRDPKVATVLEQVFDDYVDGRLLWKYRLSSAELPRDMECIRDAVGDLGKDGFVLDGAARILMSCGIEELQAYRLLWDAVQEGVLTPFIPSDTDNSERDHS